MSVELATLKCPGCGAEVNIEDGQDYVLCSYCGSKIFVHGDNVHTVQNVNAAELKRAETEQMIWLERKAALEKKRESNKKKLIAKIIVSIILVTIGAGMMLLGNEDDFISLYGFFPIMAVVYIWLLSAHKEDDDDVDIGDKIKVPSLPSFEESSYVLIEAKLKAAGFTDVTCIPLCDLTMGLLNKPSTVASVTIKGKEITSGGKKFSPDAPVVISYHSFKK